MDLSSTRRGRPSIDSSAGRRKRHSSSQARTDDRRPSRSGFENIDHTSSARCLDNSICPCVEPPRRILIGRGASFITRVNQAFRRMSRTTGALPGDYHLRTSDQVERSNRVIFLAITGDKDKNDTWTSVSGCNMRSRHDARQNKQPSITMTRESSD